MATKTVERDCPECDGVGYELKSGRWCKLCEGYGSIFVKEELPVAQQYGVDGDEYENH